MIHGDSFHAPSGTAFSWPRVPERRYWCLADPSLTEATVVPHPQPTTYPSSHPVCLRPTHRGAVVVQGVKVERATVRTTLTPWAATAWLCLGRRWSGWEPHDAHHESAGTRERCHRHPRAVAPPPEACLEAAGLVLVSCPRAYPVVGARRRRQRRAGRRQERGRSQSREARPAERSAAGCLDAGENIKALSTYLGHTDSGFTLRTYTHLLPSSESRARVAMDKVYLGRSSGPHGPQTAQS